MTSLEMDMPVKLRNFPFETWREYFAYGLAARAAPIFTATQSPIKIEHLEDFITARISTFFAKHKNIGDEAMTALQGVLEKYAAQINDVLEVDKIND